MQTAGARVTALIERWLLFLSDVGELSLFSKGGCTADVEVLEVQYL